MTRLRDEIVHDHRAELVDALAWRRVLADDAPQGRDNAPLQGIGGSRGRIFLSSAGDALPFRGGEGRGTARHRQRADHEHRHHHHG